MYTESHNPMKVICSKFDVRRFNDSWLCSRLDPSRHYWFEFDQDGDLIDTDVPEHSDGPESAALCADALEWLKSRDWWQVEYTDTFAGEANYSWVKRAMVTLAPESPDTWCTSAAGVARKRRAYNRELVKAAKAAMDLTGVRGRMYNHGDMFEFRPYRSCTVMFITWSEKP